jgi:hypothetical protein
LFEKVRLFALQSYEVVDHDLGHYTVRIHSSTRGGSPVVCLWKIDVIDGEMWMVRRADEDVPGAELRPAKWDQPAESLDGGRRGTRS